MVSLENDIFGILKTGTHYCNDLGTGLASRENFRGKCIFHLISHSQTSVAIIDRHNLTKLFEAYPEWKPYVRKLNN